MAIGLPKYKRQTQISGTGTAQVIDPSLAIKAAGASDEVVSEISASATKLANPIIELEQKKYKADQYNLQSELETQKRIADAMYKKYRETNPNMYQDWLTENDKGYANLLTEYAEIGQDPRLDKFPDLKKKINIAIKYGLEENQAIAEFDSIAKTQEIGKSNFNTQYDEFIKLGNIEAANELVDVTKNAGIISDKEAMIKKIEFPRLVNEKQATDLAFKNPYEFMKIADKQLSGEEVTYEFIGKDKLNTLRKSAQASWNSNAALVTDNLWERVYDAARNNNVTELTIIAGEALKADQNNTIKAKEAQSIYKFAINPFSKEDEVIVPLSIQTDLYTKVSAYTTENDPENNIYLSLYNQIAHIENSTIKTQLKNILEDSRQGKLQSVAYKDLMKIIDADQKRDLFGESQISDDVALFAKSEITNYLRENPNDAEGALKLYEAIKKKPNDELSKKYFRNTYSYGLMTNVIPKVDITNAVESINIDTNTLKTIDINNLEEDELDTFNTLGI
mgnify:CR=1 FL=1